MGKSEELAGVDTYPICHSWLTEFESRALIMTSGYPRQEELAGSHLLVLISQTFGRIRSVQFDTRLRMRHRWTYVRSYRE